MPSRKGEQAVRKYRFRDVFAVTVITTIHLTTYQLPTWFLVVFGVLLVADIATLISTERYKRLEAAQ
ncbi:hypothetical protein [Austwickia sp. TVS 96-490-7B]|uniref:hypothetical protein n=1 Tax=Austwickia sp. TVS 96-490-7B TaxID=2830843 RepID=UPI001C59A237|nr:hypothetical protein [Austwickia sp. TVS 96-490-7B]